jgi:hypothetical protein
VSISPTTGQIVVVWKDNAGCKGQRFSQDGVRTPYYILASDPCNGGASVASLAPGGFVTLGIQNGATSGTLTGYRYDETGTELSPFTANTYTTGLKASVGLASASNGSFVAVWSSTKGIGDGGGYGVYARRFLYSGEPAGLIDEFVVNSSTTGDQRGSAVAMDGSGNFVVVWHGSIQPAGTCCAHIYGKRFNASGTPRGGEFLVSAFGGPGNIGNYFPDVATDPVGNFVVVWTSYNQYGNYSYNIMLQQFSSSGTPLGGISRANSYTNGKMGLPKVTRPDANFVITWQELQGDGSGYAVMARRFLGSGVPIGAPFVVNSYTPGDQASPAIASRPSGPYIVVWSSSQVSGAMHDVFGQRFCLNGDVNGDGVRDVADVFYLINFLFASGPAPLGCSDVNGTFTLDVADVFYLINYLFAGGPAPV